MFGVGNFVSASTIPFDITVTAYGPSNPDPYSYREIKDDDEQKYYVRATSMDHERGLFTFKSCSIDGTVAVSYTHLARFALIEWSNIKKVKKSNTCENEIIIVLQTPIHLSLIHI